MNTNDLIDGLFEKMAGPTDDDIATTEETEAPTPKKPRLGSLGKGSTGTIFCKIVNGDFDHEDLAGLIEYENLRKRPRQKIIDALSSRLAKDEDELATAQKFLDVINGVTAPPAAAETDDLDGEDIDWDSLDDEDDDEDSDPEIPEEAYGLERLTEEDEDDDEPTPIYKLGDNVQSAPDSSDCSVMGKVWEAVIHEVRTGFDHTSDGAVYETLGWWRGADRSKQPTLRQLHAKHLVPLTGTNPHTLPAGDPEALAQSREDVCAPKAKQTVCSPIILASAEEGSFVHTSTGKLRLVVKIGKSVRVVRQTPRGDFTMGTQAALGDVTPVIPDHSVRVKAYEALSPKDLLRLGITLNEEGMADRYSDNDPQLEVKTTTTRQSLQAARAEGRAEGLYAAAAKVKKGGNHGFAPYVQKEDGTVHIEGTTAPTEYEAQEVSRFRHDQELHDLRELVETLSSAIVVCEQRQLASKARFNALVDGLAALVHEVRR